jgi:hypothetical protein
VTIKKIRAQRCCANTSTGDRCGKWCAAGDTVCAIHNPNAVPVGIVAQQDTDDLRELLRRLTRDRDPAIRLRAIEAQLKREERQTQACPKCAAGAEDERARNAYLDAMTVDERTELAVLVGQFRALKGRIYERRPDLRPSWWTQTPIESALPDGQEDILTPGERGGSILSEANDATDRKGERDALPQIDPIIKE